MSRPRKRKEGRGVAYGEIHHARLGRLLDVLALRDLGVGVELYTSSISIVISRIPRGRCCIGTGGAYVEQLIVRGPRLDLARLVVDFGEFGGRHVDGVCLFFASRRVFGVRGGGRKGCGGGDAYGGVAWLTGKGRWGTNDAGAAGWAGPEVGVAVGARAGDVGGVGFM